MEFSPATDYLALTIQESGGPRGLAVYETDEWELVHVDYFRGWSNWGVSFSPDGEYVSWGRGNGDIRIFDTDSWELTEIISGSDWRSHEHEYTDEYFAHTNDAGVYVYEYADEFQQLEHFPDADTRGFAFSNDGTYLAYSDNSTVIIRDTDEWEVVSTLDAADGQIRDIEFLDADGTIAYVDVTYDTVYVHGEPQPLEDPEIELKDTSGDGIPDAVAEMDFIMPKGDPGVVGQPIHIDPLLVDTSGDGLLDNESIEFEYEIVEHENELVLEAQITNVTANPGLLDTSNNGLSDFTEVEVWDTDPLRADTSGDGFIDSVDPYPTVDNSPPELEVLTADDDEVLIKIWPNQEIEEVRTTAEYDDPFFNPDKETITRTDGLEFTIHEPDQIVKTPEQEEYQFTLDGRTPNSYRLSIRDEYDTLVMKEFVPEDAGGISSTVASVGVASGSAAATDLRSIVRPRAELGWARGAGTRAIGGAALVTGGYLASGYYDVQTAPVPFHPTHPDGVTVSYPVPGQQIEQEWDPTQDRYFPIEISRCRLNRSNYQVS